MSQKTTPGTVTYPHRGLFAGGVGGPSTASVGVTQQTNRTTAVIANALAGQITTNNASLAAEASADFVVNNNKVEAGDLVLVAMASGSNGGGTAIGVVAVAAGSFTIRVTNNNVAAGTAETGAIVITFMVFKGAL
jgi:hypothetical protein